MAIWCLCFCGMQWRAFGQLCDNLIPRKEDSLNNPASLREPPMVTHDFSAPIPAGTLRISVICNDHLHRTDLLMVKVPDTIRAFEEFIGIILSAEDGRCTPEAAKVCTEVTVSAAQTCDEFIVTTSALWRFLFDPVEYAINTHRLGGMAQNNGSALLAASLDLPGDHWHFQLFAMPRWPAL